MSAKRVLGAAVVSVLLTACGGTGTQATLPADGTYGSTPLTQATAPGAAASDTSYPITNASGTIDTTASSTAPTASTTASATVPVNGYTFAGIVTDQATGKPLPNAMVSIGSATLLTQSDGSFSFTGILDPTITVDVTLAGYVPLTQQTVTLTGTVVKKRIQMAPTLDAGTTNTGSASGTASTTVTPTASFRQDLTFSASFQSVSDLVVVDNKVYVLGVVDPTIGFDHGEVDVYDATSGQQLESFSKTGFFTHIPKSATLLSVTNGQVSVSDGTTSYAFDATGKFLQKGTDASTPPATTATDSTNNRTYTLKGGNQVDVKTADGDTLLTLPGVTNALSIGVSLNGTVLVLDGTSNTVLGFTYLPPQ